MHKCMCDCKLMREYINQILQSRVHACARYVVGVSVGGVIDFCLMASKPRGVTNAN